MKRMKRHFESARCRKALEHSNHITINGTALCGDLIFVKHKPKSTTLHLGM